MRTMVVSHTLKRSGGDRRSITNSIVVGENNRTDDKILPAFQNKTSLSIVIRRRGDFGLNY